MHQFFEEITVLGLHNIPVKGPVIFCGNHNNQFVDGCILYATTSRDARFMVAAKVSFFIYQNFLSYFLICKLMSILTDFISYRAWKDLFLEICSELVAPFQLSVPKITLLQELER